jgi:hypothetical protein
MEDDAVLFNRRHPLAEYSKAKLEVISSLLGGCKSTYTYPPDQKASPWSPCVMCFRPMVMHGKHCEIGGKGILDLLCLSTEQRCDLFLTNLPPWLFGLHPSYRATMSTVEKQYQKEGFVRKYGTGDWETLMRNDESFLLFISGLE